MSTVTIHDLTFVIRSAGERTVAASHAALLAAVQLAGGGESQVHLIAERPFSAAVRRTLELGLAHPRPFVVGMDADVLLARDGLANMLHTCRTMGPSTYSVAGLVLCRFFGGYCFRGVHIYRREHLAPALGLIDQRAPQPPGGVDPDLKPETALVEAMKARGYGFEAHPLPLGIHDFEQSYRHIYLKMRLRARRQVEIDFKEGGVGDLLAVCERGATSERSAADFIVARWGLEDGVADARRKLAGEAVPPNYDWFAPIPEFDRRMSEIGWSEKPALDARLCESLADGVMRDHDVRADGRTPGWIREKLLGRAAA